MIDAAPDPTLANADASVLKAITELWRLFPHTFAQKASYGRWKPYPYLKHLSNKMWPSLARGGGRFIVTMPPRHGKSEFISHWIPTWYLDMFPWRRVGLATYSASFARKWGKRVKQEFDSNPHVRHELAGDTKAGDRFEIRHGHKDQEPGLMMTAGVDGPFTGEGFHLIIIDDPFKNWKEANSEVRRQNLKDWWRSVVETRLEPNATVVILMTRWHEDDLVGWLLDMQDSEDKDPELVEDWEVINLPAIAEEKDPIGRPIGEALCPKRYGKKALAKKEVNVGPRVWEALFQQRPTAAIGDVLQRGWWQYWDKPPECQQYIQSWDFRFGDKKDRGSWVVGQVWGRINADFYLLDQVRGRWGFVESKNELLDMTIRWPQATRILIENKANGPAIENDLKNDVVGLELVEPMGGKIVRAIASQGAVKSGHVWIPHPDKYPWSQKFIDEAAAFTADESHKEDDQVDAGTQAIIWFLQITNSALLKLINQ